MPTQAEVRDLSLKKASLLEEISKLGVTLEKLDKTVASHEGQKAEYIDLTSSIAELRDIESVIAADVSSLIESKNLLESKILNVKEILTEKESHLAEIEKYKEMIKVLQKEHVLFTANFSKEKSKLESQYNEAKEKLVNLGTLVTEVISKVE